MKKETLIDDGRDSVYEVLAVRYGTRVTERSEVYLNYHLYGEPDGAVRMDYFFWIARNRHRTVVIDTGFHPEVGRRRGREVLCPPVEAFGRLGIDPATVAQLVVTHGHYDHIGNLAAFGAAEILASRRELEFWAGPYGDRRQFTASTEPEELAAFAAAHRDGRVTYVGGEDGHLPGISVVEVGGHTPGQLVVLVDTAGGRAVLSSDAVHFYEEYERDRPFAFVADVEAMYRAFDLLRELASESGSCLVAGHDPEVMTRFPSAGLDGLAVRIG